MSLLKYCKKYDKTSALDPCNVYESKMTSLITLQQTNWKKVQESLKVAREEKEKELFMPRKTSKKSQSIGQFVELQRLSENSQT